MANIVLTDEDKRNLKYIALELREIRKFLDQLAETLVKLSDKELLKALDVEKEDVKEKQVDTYRETLEKQIDIAEREFQT